MQEISSKNFIDISKKYLLSFIHSFLKVFSIKLKADVSMSVFFCNIYRRESYEN